MTGLPEGALLAQIKELIAAQLLREVESDHFVFRHALTRQAIYQGLLGRERRNLHQTLFNAVESRATGGESWLADLAYHAHAGQQWQRSLHYSRRAGEQAQALFAPRAAAEHFSHAIEAATHLAGVTASKWGALLRSRAQLYETVGEFDLARSDYEAALTLAQSSADAHAAWENLFRLGFLWTARNMAQAGDYLDWALAVARTLADPALLAASLNRIGNWRLNMEQPLAALQHHHEALTILNGQADQAGLALTHDLLGITHIVSGDYPVSVAHHNQAIARYRQLDKRMSLSSCLGAAALRGGCYQGDVAVFADLGIDLFLGDGRFGSANTVEVVNGDQTTVLNFKKALIATGTRPAPLPVPGLAEAGYLTNERVFEMTERPQRLAVIGAGPIDAELAQSFRRFGSEVIVFDVIPRMLGREDPDAATVIKQVFEGEGIRLALGAKISEIQKVTPVRRWSLNWTDKQKPLQSMRFWWRPGARPIWKH